ncbi:PITH domain-containing protein [Ceratobasidium sp. AG-Ba]|nr:PITH domain-containing protein [Ceratobasidium sp. AG-Ba]QRW04979.1 PITH domain-containing protein [Ceratobasidium sp. AG-Ba]
MSRPTDSVQNFLSDAQSTVANNLFGVIDRDKVHGLNLSVPENAKEVIKPWDERDSTEKWCETNVDDELILHVPFSRNVRVRSILLKTSRGEAQPRRLRVYANHPAGLDFAEAESTRPQQDISLLEGETGVVEYPVKASAFANVIALTLFLNDTAAGETNRIYFVGFKGDSRDFQKDVSERLDLPAANAADAPIDRITEKAAGSQSFIH